MKKELIVFDFFGVISTEVFPRWAKKYFNDKEYNEIRNNIVLKGDIGEINTDDMFNNLGKLVGLDGVDVFNEWLELAVINDEMIKLILELKRDYKIALLSNASSDFIWKVLERLNTNELFDYMVISADVKMIKPNRDIFEYLMSKANMDSSKLVFIDDNLINIEGAEKVGIKGILFKNVECLRTELREIL